ncbi:MAG: hypothetical protein BWY51_00740 [Parcubacteria group bacterium ADurb.Bin316]|nr:MAG: hypothetical protein BWY51_00740 [Parcubacteria group bacterium ADurb.Bin316]HOZ56113.1 hypothetical protein [bacterium]
MAIKTITEESPEIERLKAEIQNLIAEHPELAVLQAEIDRIRETTFDPLERLNSIFCYIGENLHTLREGFDEIKKIASQANGKS